MNVKTYRARSLPEALRLVEQELGPRATVLSTEQGGNGIFHRLMGANHVQVTAMAEGAATQDRDVPNHDGNTGRWEQQAEPQLGGYRERMKQFATEEQSESLLETMIQRHKEPSLDASSTSLFQLFTDLIENDVDDRFAEAFLHELKHHLTPSQLEDTLEMRDRAAKLLREKIRTATPLEQQAATRRVVALIGPTGVGKTTTIAKLAANLRLREKRNVGLITVDTYRIAAVDQLRAYADIIDLPMEVVTTPREMRDATLKLSDLDLVLIDTAGRSHHDKVQIQELKAMLHEARADEVHLVLSSVSHARHLSRVVEHFRVANPTSLLLTKLDETTAHGHLLPLLCDAGLPLSYTTHGQNVPDDIQPADPARLVESVLAVANVN